MPTRFHVRRFRLSDMDRIEEIERASFGRDAYDRNLFAEYLRKCGDLFLVALRGGHICGYSITCIRAGTLPAELVSIAVDPASRGKGAASILMAATFRRLRRRGIARISLTVKVTNFRARRFYQNWGFTLVRRVPAYYEDGRDGLRMVANVTYPLTSRT